MRSILFGQKALVLFILSMISIHGWSAPKLKTGKEVANFVEKSNQGFKSEVSTIELIIEDSNGNKVTRKMNSKGIEIDEDASRSLIEFIEPADVKGTKLLTWSFRNEDDSQWLYLKSMRRSKRITSSNRYSSFMGSEFTYEDFSTKYTEKSNHKLIKQDKSFWWLKKVPKSDETDLTREMKISKVFNQVVEVKYFKANNTLQKVGVFTEFDQYKVDGKKFFRASKITMQNKITGKSSTMLISDRKLGKSLKVKDFKKESLR